MEVSLNLSSPPTPAPLSSFFFSWYVCVLEDSSRTRTRARARTHTHTQQAAHEWSKEAAERITEWEEQLALGRMAPSVFHARVRRQALIELAALAAQKEKLLAQASLEAPSE